jgi:hypothetical protein
LPIVLTGQPFGREAKLVINFGEPIVRRETLSNDRQPVEIDRPARSRTSVSSSGSAVMPWIRDL